MELPDDLLILLFEIYVEYPHIGTVHKAIYELSVTEIPITPASYCIMYSFSRENLKKFYSKSIIKLCNFDCKFNFECPFIFLIKKNPLYNIDTLKNGEYLNTTRPFIVNNLEQIKRKGHEVCNHYFCHYLLVYENFIMIHRGCSVLTYNK